jgi:hypothetical protein
VLKDYPAISLIGNLNPEERRMIIELSDLPEAARSVDFAGSQVIVGRIGFIIVYQLPGKPMQYYPHDMSDEGYFGQNERPRIFNTIAEPAKIVKDYPRLSGDLSNEVRVALWIDNNLSMEVLGLHLGRTLAPGLVGELVFAATGSEVRSNAAEAAARRSSDDLSRRDTEDRRDRSQQQRPRRQRSRRW